jgi:hypothetical protein
MVSLEAHEDALSGSQRRNEFQFASLGQGGVSK